MGGTDAEIGRYPYIGTLERSPPPHLLPELIESGGFVWNGSLFVMTCGVSLIAPDVVLSAAHCGETFGKKVRIGLHNASFFVDDNNDDFSYYEEFRIERAVWHPLYDGSGGLRHDVMVAKLRGRSFFRPVRLNDDPRVPDGSTTLRVVGFGRRDPLDVRSGGGVLQQAEGYVTDERTCNYYYTNENTRAKTIFDDMLCVDYSMGRQCRGDSGSPLIVPGSNDPSEDVQVGIVSFSFNCAEPPFPGVHASVSHHYDWIAETVCEISDDPPAYLGCHEPSPTFPTPLLTPTATPRMMTPAVIDVTRNRHPASSPSSSSLCPPINMTIAVNTDAYPEETGWRVYALDETMLDDDAVIVGEVPPWGVVTTAPFQQRFGTILLDSLDGYAIAVTDALNDGIGGLFDSVAFSFSLTLEGRGGRQTRVVVQDAGGFWREIRYRFVHNTTSQQTGCYLHDDNNNTVFLAVFARVVTAGAAVVLERLDTLDSKDGNIVFTTDSLDLWDLDMNGDTNVTAGEMLWLVIPIGGLQENGLYRISALELPPELASVARLYSIAAFDIRDPFDPTRTNSNARQTTFVPGGLSQLEPFLPMEGEASFLVEMELTPINSGLEWILMVGGGCFSETAPRSLVAYGPLDQESYEDQSTTLGLIQHPVRIHPCFTANSTLYLKMSSVLPVVYRVVGSLGGGTVLVQEGLVGGGGGGDVPGFVSFQLGESLVPPDSGPTRAPSKAPTMTTTSTRAPSPRPSLLNSQPTKPPREDTTTTTSPQEELEDIRDVSSATTSPTSNSITIVVAYMLGWFWLSH